MDFTIVVPTYQRPDELAGCLDALAALDYPRELFEVIVVNDGGAREFERDVAERAAAKLEVRFLWQPNRGPGAARNLGASEARGRWLAFTDDDCRPHLEWLNGLRLSLEAGDDVLCGGCTVNQLTSNVYSSASQLIADAAYRFYNSDPSHGRFLASNNMAVWRRKLLDLGGFDEQFRVASEDRELCDRWRWRGGRIVWSNAAVVEHRHVLNLRRFVRQQYAYGRGAALYHQARFRRGTGFVWDDLQFRWSWIDLILKPALATPRPVTTIALMAVWQAANTAGFVREALAAKAWR